MSVLTHPSAATETVPTWPRIVATITAGGPHQVIIDGEVHEVADVADKNKVQEAILRLVRDHARTLGRTVRMDTAGQQGGHQVLVPVDGIITYSEPDAEPTHPRPRQQSAHQRNEAPAVEDSPVEDSAVAAHQWADLPPAPADQPEPPAHPAERAELREPAQSLRTVVTKPVEPVELALRPAVVVERSAAPTTPTLEDLLGGRARTRTAPAAHGWRAGLRALSGGAISPAPGRFELDQRAAAAAIARPLDGPKTIVVVNPKGGAHKTTAALLLAANLGRHRGGSTLAWDNNETRGTMGWRASQSAHNATVIDLLADLEAVSGPHTRVGDLDAYVRNQPWGHFDVLASDEDANSADLVDGDAFERLHTTLSRFYRVMVVDTGNNMRAPNWAAALAAADQLVIVSTIREDTSQSAAWLADALRAHGQSDLVDGAVTVLTAPARTADAALGARLHDHFAALTRTVLCVPHDPALIAGGPIDYAALTAASRDAWLHVTAAVTDGL